jgi:uncharacterized protein (TIGR03083 family)
MMGGEDTWRAVDTARAALADELETLTEAEWERPSHCPCWTVPHVAAHVISSPQATAAGVAAAMWRARGDFNRCVRDEAIRHGARPPAEIVADYRRLAGSRRTPPGVTVEVALLDVVVHTHDALDPLGRHRPMPPCEAAVAAEQVWRHSFPFRARRRLRGLRLTATDVAWSAGAGAPVEGPIQSLLLVLTGRSAGLRALSGDGLEEMRGRIAQT